MISLRIDIMVLYIFQKGMVINMNNNTYSTIENYREFFTKEYLMGPNSLRLLDEMLRKYPLKEGSRYAFGMDGRQ